MKIKTKALSYDAVLALPRHKKFHPKRPNILFRTLLKAVSLPELFSVGFKCQKIGMERLGKKEPAVFLMNHSSFIDLKIAASILYPRAFNIVTTTDGFVGKNMLMRNLGCIPTNKFVFDFTLLRNLQNAVKKNSCSVLMHPEACYSFDGKATTLGENLGKFIKLMGVPLVMIRTYGAFSRDPLYNNLQKRKVKVSADMEYLLSADEIREKSADEIQCLIEEQFSFDGFRWQAQNGILIDEPFRADGLNRVLYKCPHCLSEGKMLGKGVKITSGECGGTHTLSENGTLVGDGADSKFEFVSDWYAWEREQVKCDIDSGSYEMSLDVDIAILRDSRCLYSVGDGTLTHNENGFTLYGCDGKLSYSQKPLATYTLNSDFFWYEMGDVIAIGDNDILYYCFPKNAGDVVAKARLATEELYKKAKQRVRVTDQTKALTN